MSPSSKGWRRRIGGGGRTPSCSPTPSAARGACSQHFEPGERVAVWAHNLPEWVLLEYGAALAGLTLVTVNPSLQPAEAAYVLGQSRAAGLFLVPEVRGNPLAAHAEAIRGDLPELRHVLRLDQLAELMADRRLDGRHCRRSAPTTRCRSSTRAARPGSRRARCCATAASSTTPGCGPTGSRSPTAPAWLMPMPLFHTGGCVMGVLGALDRRATLVLMPMFEPGLFLELIELERPWFAAAVPTMLIAAMDHPDAQRRDLSSWRSTVSGGCPGARGAGAADRGGARRRLHDRLRPDRVLAGAHQHASRPTAPRTRA